MTDITGVDYLPDDDVIVIDTAVLVEDGDA